MRRGGHAGRDPRGGEHGYAPDQGAPVRSHERAGHCPGRDSRPGGPGHLGNGGADPGREIQAVTPVGPRLRGEPRNRGRQQARAAGAARAAPARLPARRARSGGRLAPPGPGAGSHDRPSPQACARLIPAIPARHARAPGSAPAPPGTSGPASAGGCPRRRGRRGRPAGLGRAAGLRRAAGGIAGRRRRFRAVSRMSDAKRRPPTASRAGRRPRRNDSRPGRPAGWAGRRPAGLPAGSAPPPTRAALPPSPIPQTPPVGPSSPCHPSSHLVTASIPSRTCRHVEPRPATPCLRHVSQRRRRSAATAPPAHEARRRIAAAPAHRVPP